MKTSENQNIDWRFQRLSRLAPSKVKREARAKSEIKGKPTIKDDPEKYTENLDLIQTANRFYDSLADVRKRRRRTYRYITGDQWHELITDPDDPTQVITEEENITRKGRPAIRNNIMAQIRQNIIGRYMTNKMKPMIIARGKENARKSEMMSNALRHAHTINECEAKYTLNFDEMALSGIPVAKIGYKYNPTRNTEDVSMLNVNPELFFFNTDIKDISLSDLRFIGEILDVTLDELIGVFAKNDADKQLIESWYQGNRGDRYGLINQKGMDKSQVEQTSFVAPSDNNKCRVFEIWYKRSEWRTRVHDYLTGDDYVTKKSLDDIALENELRIMQAAADGVSAEEVPLKEASRKYETFWWVKYLTPEGKCLFEGETTYWHEEHPYVFYAYPLLNGEIRGAYEDIIDQQRYINRLIIMIDSMMGTLTKGTLLVPEDAIPDDMDIDDFAEEWSKVGGVIRFKAKPGVALPQQVQSNISNIGATDMLMMQIKLMQEISGINYAIQGQRAPSGTPASLYAQEAMNSSVNSKYLMDSYTRFMKRCDYKMLKVIHQFYKGKRMLAIAGDSYSDIAKEYDAAEVRDFDFEYDLTQSTDTPTFRQVTDEILLNMLEKNLITLEMYLEHSSMPFANSLLDTVKTYKQEMAKQQQGIQGAGQPQLPPELQQQQQMRPEVTNIMNKMLQNEQA